MASTAIVDDLSGGNFKIEVVDVTFDNSYPTGGEAVTLTQIGNPLFGIATVKSSSSSTVDNVVEAHYDPATNKVLLWLAAGAQAASTADCTDLVVQVVVFGY
jgi:hypothetical protein